MAYNYGLVSTASVGSANQIGATTANNLSGINKIAIRVFDAAVISTSNTLALYNGTSVSGTLILYMDKNNTYIHSDAGWLFPNGCFAVATGGTGNLTWIQEII